VHDDQEGRTSDKDELQGPEADVGDGEEVVIADVGAARLPRVAVKVLLLVAPHALGRHHIDQHTENKDHGEPDAAEGCGVLVDPAEQRLQRLPIHGGWRRSESPNLEKHQQKQWVKSNGGTSLFATLHSAPPGFCPGFGMWGQSHLQTIKLTPTLLWRWR
uniref:Uncharacterized protein n=1 Tax=Amazona collaria TaxID=241587 RepID=A0A8B9F3Q1_9PSIT